MWTPDFPGCICLQGFCYYQSLTGNHFKLICYNCVILEYNVKEHVLLGLLIKKLILSLVYIVFRKNEQITLVFAAITERNLDVSVQAETQWSSAVALTTDLLSVMCHF